MEEKAKTQIQLQYDSIKLQLDIFLDDQMKNLEKMKKNELQSIEQETTQLEQRHQEIKTLEEKGLELMEHKGSSSFVSESNALLEKRHLAKMTHVSQNIRNPPAEPSYQRPTYWQGADSEEFRQLVQAEILGHFSIQQSQELVSPAAIIDPGTPRRSISFPASNIQGSFFSLTSQTPSRRSKSADSLRYSSTHSLADPSRFYRQKRYGLRGSFTSLQEEPTFMRNPPESIG